MRGPWPKHYGCHLSIIYHYSPALIHKDILKYVINPRHAYATMSTVVVSCICLSVCLSGHAILAARAIKSIIKDIILLSIKFAAILKMAFFLINKINYNTIINNISALFSLTSKLL